MWQVSVTPFTTVCPDTQLVSLHTYSGVQVYQFLDNELTSLEWSREADEVSRCEVTVPSTLDYDRLPDIVPWLHWVSVWDDTGQDLLWTGPVQRLTANRQAMTLSCRDVAALFTRTRCPLLKKWEVTDPTEIADELITAMAEAHGLNIAAVVRPDPYGDKFDFTAPGETSMLDESIDDLVTLGLRWSVVSGVPLLGPLPHTPVASLGETDFVGGGMTIVRDGATTFNDVLLRGGDNDLARARVPMAGLNLQTVQTIDSMSGVGNVDRAVRQFARYVSVIRDSVTLPDNAVLHPTAPISLTQLVPSARLSIDAYGMLLPMELVGVDVSYSAGVSTARIRMAGVNDDLPEVIEVQSRPQTSKKAVS